MTKYICSCGEVTLRIYSTAIYIDCCNCDKKATREDIKTKPTVKNAD